MQPRAFNSSELTVAGQSRPSRIDSRELGFDVAADPVHVPQATVLRLLNFDHARLTWRFQGGDFRLADVHGSVADGPIA